MTMNHPPIVRKPKEGRTVAVVGGIYRLLATGEETADRYDMREAIVPPGGGPPPHIHSREEESFYIPLKKNFGRAEGSWGIVSVPYGHPRPPSQQVSQIV